MNGDRLTRLERQVALIARQISGMPVRIATGGGGGSAAILTATIADPIDAGSADDPTEGEAAHVYRVNENGDTDEVASNVPLWNPFGQEVSGSVTCTQIGSSNEYLIVGISFETSLTCSTIEVVTGVSCVDDEIVADTDEITYVSGPCP